MSNNRNPKPLHRGKFKATHKLPYDKGVWIYVMSHGDWWVAQCGMQFRKTDDDGAIPLNRLQRNQWEMGEAMDRATLEHKTLPSWFRVDKKATLDPKGPWGDHRGPVKVLGVAAGWVTCQRPKCRPFCVTVAEFKLRFTWNP